VVRGLGRGSLQLGEEAPVEAVDAGDVADDDQEGVGPRAGGRGPDPSLTAPDGGGGQGGFRREGEVWLKYPLGPNQSRDGSGRRPPDSQSFTLRVGGRVGPILGGPE